MSELLQLVSQSGVNEFLHGLLQSVEGTFHRNELENNLGALGNQAPSAALDSLVANNLVQQIGVRFGLSQFGHKIALLIDAMHGADVEDVVRRLRRLEGSTEIYQLVRQGMTTRFLNTFIDHPYFGSLYLCSPWINLNYKEASLIRYGVLHSEKRTGKKPDIMVITRPLDDKEYPRQRASGLGLQPLIEMGARTYYVNNVHTKLYIREPDANGGYTVALVGSENLTQSNLLELGIQINGDGRLISQLTAHFFELTNYSSEQG
jgi:hypothetical protein